MPQEWRSVLTINQDRDAMLDYDSVILVSSSPTWNAVELDAQSQTF